MVDVQDMGYSEKLPLENGDISCQVVLPKFKRRKVSAVRDFPPGCGPNAPKINIKPTEATVPSVVEENSVGVEKKCDALEVGTAKISENEVDFQSTESSKGLAPMDTPVLLNDLESKEGKAVVQSEITGGGELVNVECLGIEFPVASNNVVIEPSKELEYNTVELSNSRQPAECFGLVKNADALERKNVLKGEGLDENMLSGSLKQVSSPTWPAAGAIVENNVTKKYPPRRRISATRDFPPLCGRHVAELAKDKCLKATAYSENKILGEDKSSMEHKLMEEMVKTDVKRNGENVEDGVSVRNKMGGIVSKETENKDLAEPGTGTAREMDMQVQPKTSPKIRAVQDDTKMKSVKRPQESNLRQQDHEYLAVDKIRNTNVGSFEEKAKREPVTVSKEKSSKRRFSATTGGVNQPQLEDPSGLETASGMVIVLGLMAAPYCPWRQGKGANKPNLAGGTSGSKGKKNDFASKAKGSSSSATKKNGSEKLGGKSLKKATPTGKGFHKVMNQSVVRDAEDSSEDDEGHGDYRIVQRSQHMNVSMLPFFGLITSGDHDATVTRSKVRETLRLFQAICRKLLQEEEARSKEERNMKRIDLLAARILKDKGKYVNTGKQIIGIVAGVEVGDEFQYRVELTIIGLHRQMQSGIDYLKKDGKIIASSIVASGGYADDLDNPDLLIYSGSGGNVTSGDKQPEDQKLERGNLALKNSIDAKNPVRVIRGFKESKASDSSDARAKIVSTYTYDGLYLVEKFWQEMGQHGKLVFKFQLRRISDQPELAWREVKKSKKFKVREGICANDISEGKELMTICAVNTLDDEKPPPFTYITSMKYPSWYCPPLLGGCDCIDGCSDSERCSCAVKNGGEIPYNHNGAIVEAKPLVYECGSSCKCPPSCHNRVSQNGIKFQLEIFKTESRGWGVRSLNSIPSGSFICEYAGELLEEKEAEQRTGNDEYLFDIGHNYNDHTLWGGLASLMPDAQSSSCEGVEDGGFTIDAAEFGSVARFINHSCSPNLYAQNVLYDRGDKRMPHIMLFAAENIPPLQELTYHYNYAIDQVRDSDGNIKKKTCYCGSLECTGRMY